ncbi:hypothetical protein PRK78_000847 [Emydomyces testavorans]|uniref:Transcription factor 25 n=1 Tax=Emydomyces testavorans TaxID=2070801 RepID=A0AAF0DCU2_9EURO|nr:hypothetical protein PRK78_000847 [Emydomyces testavorans]
MSSRALRRLQKQRQAEQQEAEQSNASTAASQDLEPTISRFNAFDFLEAQDADEEGPNNAEEEEPNDEEGPLKDELESEPIPSSKPTSTKKKKHKGKKKKQGKRDVAADAKPSGTKTLENLDLDDIDRALRELAIKKTENAEGNLTAGQSTLAEDETETTLCALLAIDPRKLDAMNEMRRLFGSAVVGNRYTENREGSPSWRRNTNRQALDLGRALTGQFNPASRGQGPSGMALRKNVLMQGKDEWPQATSGGLGMEIVKKKPSGVTEYKLVHNAAYTDVQRQFAICVESMQPERMIEHLQSNPYHISTLLQVSEIAKLQGDHAVSGDLLERALFNIGRSLLSSFGPCLKEGKARLDFKVKENREVWLAGWRYIINVGMKGTWKTAYEWAKLLLSLDTEDPYCISLTIDQIAIKAREHEHFIEICSHPTFKRRWESLPNIQCTLALAYFLKGDANPSRDQLRLAICQYPWIFCRLSQELNISPVPKSIWGAQAPDGAFNLLTELYISRAKDIWNAPEVISHLVEVAESISALEPAAEGPKISLDIARHIILSDIPAATAYLPRSFTSGHISASDPLPPNELREESSGVSFHNIYNTAGRLSHLDNGEAVNNVVRQVLLRGQGEAIGGLMPFGGRDTDNEIDQRPQESQEASQIVDSYLLAQGLREITEFINVNGVDSANWPVGQDDTPIAAWVRTLRTLDYGIWQDVMRAAALTSGSPMLFVVLAQELLRQQSLSEETST